MREYLQKTTPLDAVWIRGDDQMFWTFPTPTRVCGFEGRGPISGAALSLVFCFREQLVGPIPIHLLCAGNGLVLNFPVLRVHERLVVRTSGFFGELRPVGEALEP